MSEAPREIWADVDEDDSGVFVEFLSAEAWPDATRYVRADLVQVLIEALKECTEITHKAYVSATLEAVNAGPQHPVAKQMDGWRARCMRAEEMARAALRKIEGGEG